MRRLFWYLWARFRLWYLYHGTEIPWSERPSDSGCPTCFWDSGGAEFDDKSYLGSSDRSYGYEGTQYWTEHWKCPRCGTKFENDDSE